MIVRKLFNEATFTISDDDYEYEYDDTKEQFIDGDKLTLGGYTWTRIGALQGHDLYLCDDVVREMAFNSNGRDNRWENSDVRRWLNNNFYNKLSDDEKEIIVKNRELNDNIFLLSEEKYKKFRNNIPLLRVRWWLRTPGDYDYYAAGVYFDGGIFCSNVSYSEIGVRPALLV